MLYNNIIVLIFVSILPTDTVTLHQYYVCMCTHVEELVCACIYVSIEQIIYRNSFYPVQKFLVVLSY
jgi:hypothetical protein